MEIRASRAWGPALLLALALAASSGCVSDNIIGEVQKAGATQSSADAVGFVTVSPPLFTPMDEVVGGDKRLQFGDLRKEEVIADRLERPSFGSDEVRFSLLEAALAARFAGARVSIVDRSTTGTEGAVDAEGNPVVPGDSRTRTRTFDSPEVPPAPGVPQVPEKVMERLVKLLERSSQQYVLPPDELATLVAANKTYMVNLEEYYNVEGFDFRRGLTQAYVPYKMHFTVTAEPGWFSRYSQYDAVVEVSCTLGNYPDESGSCECRKITRGIHSDDIIFLNVSPLETSADRSGVHGAAESGSHCGRGSGHGHGERRPKRSDAPTSRNGEAP